MSTTGIRVVGAIPDDEARSLPERIIATVQYRPPLTVPGYAETLAWWSKGGDKELFFEDDPGQPGTLLPTSAALRFAEFIHDANPDTDVSAALRDAVMDLLPAGDDPGLFVSMPLGPAPRPRSGTPWARQTPHCFRGGSATSC